MPIKTETYNIELTAGGGTENLSVDDAIQQYRIYSTGSVTLTSNWTIQSTGTVAAGMRYIYKYEADITLSGNTITIHGATMPEELVDKRGVITADYNGTAWVVVFKPDFNESSIVSSSNIADEAVTYSKIQQVSQGSILVGDATKTASELDARIAGRIIVGDGTDPQSVALAGDATLAAGGTMTIANNAITTVKISDANVTNAKLANMAANTIKVRDANSSGVPSDKAVADTQIIIGDGTGFTAASLSGDATMTNAGAVSVVKGTSSTASSTTTGMIMAKHMTSAQLKPLLDNTTNNLFPVSAGDIVLEIKFWTQTPAGGACTVDCGPDATARAAGADGNGILSAADANVAGPYSSNDGTYDGALQAFGGFEVDASGYITILSSTDQSGSAFVGGVTMYYISA